MQSSCCKKKMKRRAHALYGGGRRGIAGKGRAGNRGGGSAGGRTGGSSMGTTVPLEYVCGAEHDVDLDVATLEEQGDGHRGIR